jgi:hypothetical protein
VTFVARQSIPIDAIQRVDTRLTRIYLMRDATRCTGTFEAFNTFNQVSKRSVNTTACNARAWERTWLRADSGRNECSIGLRVRCGAFDGFTGGEAPGFAEAGLAALRRLLSKRICPGPRDLFASSSGHVLARVAAGRGSDQIYVLDNGSEELRVVSAHGRYVSQ